MNTDEKKYKILFLGGDSSDYLNIGLLNGLKSLLHAEVFDFPKSEILYKKNKEFYQRQIRGNGFTLFFQQDDPPLNRFHLQFDKLQSSFFDLILIGDIQNNFGFYIQYLPYLNFKNTAILDGSDSPSLYPYNGHYWRRPYYWFLPRAHNRFLYFKREWTPETISHRYFKLVPLSLSSIVPTQKNLRKISFSIPEEKIVKELPQKTKLFPKHIVDEEIAAKIDGSFTSYAFENEEEYYADLQASKFGITTKRAGWDCLRHYEIAANGAVICFKDLDKKPDTCAPHGLIPGANCITYRNYQDLMDKINALDETEYRQLQMESLNWARMNICKKRAISLLKEFQFKLD